ncbi:sensor histidine kinase [Nocardioides speluncae]|uniref:sensor histidine kinase n=1 Tax=Nocardioides speluncae TaxID=2670337 RepID=UPI000D68FFC5|nr:sensor histidine kinase [Nocardioides speluncae]
MIVSGAVVVATVVAARLLLRGSPSTFRAYVAVVLVLFATAGGHVAVVVGTLHDGFGETGAVVQGLGWVAVLQLAYVFPDGRFVPRWSGWLTVAWAVVLGAGIIVAAAGLATDAYQGIESVAVLVLVGTCLYAQVHRYRKVSGSAERRQARGVLIVIGVWFAFGAILIATPLQDLQREATTQGLLAHLAVELATAAIWVSFPLAITVSLLNHSTFVLAQLGRRLAGAIPGDDVAPMLVRSIGEALGDGRVALTMTGSPGVVAEYGRAPARRRDVLRVPIAYDDAPLGELEVATSRRITDRDRQQIDDVTQQAAVALRAAALTNELRRARERLVATREEERRRLHRDLHDGLGPTMASLSQRLQLAERFLDGDPEQARRLLDGCSEQTKAAIADLRRVVYALRPPALDELGLAGAIEEACRRFGTPDGLRIEVAADGLPSLPAGVEVAAYRIATEAVTNVARHAEATTCRVTISLDGRDLAVSVVDDGSGVPTGTSGGGLATMRERAEELGGSLSVTANRPRGTAVSARLPIGSMDDVDHE